MFLLILIVLVWLIYKWSAANLDYFEKLGVPFDKPLPLFGNMLNIFLQKESMLYVSQRSFDKFKKSKIFGFFNFKQTCFYVTDPELIKKITIKDFDYFTNHNSIATQVDRVLDRSLIALQNKEWRDMRTALSPIFTSSKMKMMYGLLSSQAQDFANFYEERAKRGEKLAVDVLDVFSRFTADGISTAVLGFEADCVRNEDSHVFKLVQKLLNEFSGSVATFKFTLAFALPKLYKFLGLQMMSQELHGFFKRVVVDVMNDRDRNNISRPDVIQLLLQTKKGQLIKNEKAGDVDDNELTNFSANIEYDVGTKGKSASQFNDEDWIAQGFVFFAAGFDSTSNLLQTISYELAKNLDVQQTLHEEIDSVASALDRKPISYETLHKMKFLDMVVSEGLRKWPPAPQTDRSCLKDYKIDLDDGKSVTIKKGEIVFLPVYLIHHDPRFYANPEKFDPYRFSDDNKSSITSGTYLPFGMGPRTCIGSRFALMEAKLLLFNFLKKFSVATCDKTPKTLSYNASLNFRYKEKVFLDFKLRNEQF